MSDDQGLEKSKEKIDALVALAKALGYDPAAFVGGYETAKSEFLWKDK